MPLLQSINSTFQNVAHVFFRSSTITKQSIVRDAEAIKEALMTPLNEDVEVSLTHIFLHSFILF